MKTKISKETKETIINLRSKKLTYIAISEKTGIKKPTIVSICLKHFGKKTIISERDSIYAEEIKKMYESGISYKEIAEKVGLSYDGVQYHIKRKKTSLSRSKHTQKIGEKHNRAKLHEQDIIDMYSLFISGWKVIDIYNSRKYDVTYSQILTIIKGKSWTHIFPKYKELIAAEIMRKKKFSSSLKKVAKRELKGEIINYPIPLCPECGKVYPCEHTA